MVIVMAEFVEFKSKDEIEAEAMLDETIQMLSKKGLIKSEPKVSVVMKPKFDKEKTQNVQACLDFIYDLLENESNKTSGKTGVSFCPGSKTNAVIESELKALHVDNVSEFANKFSKASNIDIYPHANGKTFEFDVKFNNVATPVPAGKDGVDNE